MSIFPVSTGSRRPGACAPFRRPPWCCCCRRTTPTPGLPSCPSPALRRTSPRASSARTCWRRRGRTLTAEPCTLRGPLHRQRDVGRSRQPHLQREPPGSGAAGDRAAERLRPIPHVGERQLAVSLTVDQHADVL